jgi:hypothetical protein
MLNFNVVITFSCLSQASEYSHLVYFRNIHSETQILWEILNIWKYFMRSLLHYIVSSRKQQHRNLSLAWFKLLWQLVFAILDMPLWWLYRCSLSECKNERDFLVPFSQPYILSVSVYKNQTFILLYEHWIHFLCFRK